MIAITTSIFKSNKKEKGICPNGLGKQKALSLGLFSIAKENEREGESYKLF
jgi:hypothetical protein